MVFGNSVIACYRIFTEFYNVCRMKVFLFSIILALACCLPAITRAQQPVGVDTIRLGGVVAGADTFAMVFLPNVDVADKLPRRLARKYARRREEMSRLRHNVYKVYPYAVTAADVLKDVDTYLARMDTKQERKAYLKTVEKDLNARFKGELTDLTITQGQILVKLINRQTGKNCFGIIKELKGGFSAVVWQSVALLFSNSLKKEYDPEDRDRDIELVVRELEANYYYNYQASQSGIR